MQLNIQDTFNRQLPADPVVENYPRQVAGACFSYTVPTPPRKPTLLHVSDGMLAAIGLTQADAESVVIHAGGVYKTDVVFRKAHRWQWDELHAVVGRVLAHG